MQTYIGASWFEIYLYPPWLFIKVIPEQVPPLMFHIYIHSRYNQQNPSYSNFGLGPICKISFKYLILAFSHQSLIKSKISYHGNYKDSHLIWFCLQGMQSTFQLAETDWRGRGPDTLSRTPLIRYYRMMCAAARGKHWKNTIQKPMWTSHWSTWIHHVNEQQIHFKE